MTEILVHPTTRDHLLRAFKEGDVLCRQTDVTGTPLARTEAQKAQRVTGSLGTLFSMQRAGYSLAECGFNESDQARLKDLWVDACLYFTLSPDYLSEQSLYQGLEIISAAPKEDLLVIEQRLADKLALATRDPQSARSLHILNRHEGLQEAHAGRTFSLAEKIQTRANLYALATVYAPFE